MSLPAGYRPSCRTALRWLPLIMLGVTMCWPCMTARADDHSTRQVPVADVTFGQPPPGAVSILPDGDLEAADATGQSPRGWQSIDNLVWRWTADPDHPEHGRIISIDTDINQSQAYAWWIKHYIHQAPLADAPAKQATKPPRYDTIGGLDGGFFWSAFFPIEPGKAYKVYIDAKGPKSMVFLRGYVKVLPLSFADESPAVQQLFREARHEPTLDAHGRPIRYRLRYKYTTWFAVGGSDKWQTYTHIKPRHPTSREITQDVRYLRVMIYPIWPSGVYQYDNIRVIEVPGDPQQAKPPTDEADLQEGNVIR